MEGKTKYSRSQKMLSSRGSNREAGVDRLVTTRSSRDDGVGIADFKFVPCCRDGVAGDSSGIEQAECSNSQMGVALN